MVGRAVDLHLKADLAQGELDGLGEQRQLLPAGIGEPHDVEALAVLLAHAIAVGVDPAGLLQHPLCLLGVVAGGAHRVVAKSEVAWEGTHRRGTAAVEQDLDKALLVDTQGKRMTHGRVAHHRRGVVRLRKESAARLAALDVERGVLKQRIARIRKTVGSVNLAGLQRHGKRVAVGDGPHRNVAQRRGTSPIVGVCHKRNLGVAHRRGDKGSGTCDVVVSGNTCLHVDDGAVRVAQVVDERGLGALRGDGERHAVGLDGIDLKVERGPVVHSEQVVEALLHGLRVHVATAGETHALAQLDDDRGVVRELVGLGKPALGLHRVGELEERLAHAVAHAAPTGIVGMRVEPRIVHLGAVAGGAVRERRAIGQGALRYLDPKHRLPDERSDSRASRQANEPPAGQTLACMRHDVLPFFLGSR